MGLGIADEERPAGSPEPSTFFAYVVQHKPPQNVLLCMWTVWGWNQLQPHRHRKRFLPLPYLPKRIWWGRACTKKRNITRDNVLYEKDLSAWPGKHFLRIFLWTVFHPSPRLWTLLLSSGWRVSLSILSLSLLFLLDSHNMKFAFLLLIFLYPFNYYTSQGT